MENELYKCEYCGKFISDDDGVTTFEGLWVCDNDSCRTYDEEGESFIRLK